MRSKSGLVLGIMLLVIASPLLAQSVEAVPETEGTLRGRGFIYLLEDYPHVIGYVDVSIRVQWMRHTGQLRMRASFEYTVFTEYYSEPIRALRDATVDYFFISSYMSGSSAAVEGSATLQEGTSTDQVTFSAVFYDGNGDGYVETFAISYSTYDDVPYPNTEVQAGKIALRP